MATPFYWDGSQWAALGSSAILISADMTNAVVGSAATKSADAKASKSQSIGITRSTSADQILATLTFNKATIPLGEYSLLIRLELTGTIPTSGNVFKVDVSMGSGSTFTNSLVSKTFAYDSISYASDYDCYYIPFSYVLGSNALSSNDTIKVVITSLINSGTTYNLYYDYAEIQNTGIGIVG